MSSRFQSFTMNLAALALIAAGFFYFLSREPNEIIVSNQETRATSTPAQVAAVDASIKVPPQPVSAPPKKVATTSVQAVVKKSPITETPVEEKQPDNQARRIIDPYPFPPLSFEEVSTRARAALVNILCAPRAGTGPSPISGSGVLIDPRGVILTNAHVAQYVLLAQSDRINLSCTIRTGAPAIPRWSAEILYLPPIWVELHAHDINTTNPVGTGEHDYALLRITGAVDGMPFPTTFPYLPLDTREAIGFYGDRVLAASYPAEFLSSAAQHYIYPASSVTTVGPLITFFAHTVDLISLGGIIEAQGGSSGGAVVNAWGRLIALISTTSEGETTAARDLRAITLSYINGDLAAQTQFDLQSVLGGDIAAQALDFNTRIAPRLIDLYLAQLGK